MNNEDDKPFLTFGAPAISEDEIAAVAEVLRSGWLGRGPYVERFEKAFAAYKGAPYAVAVSSGTAALHLSLLAAGIGPGDEVITTPLTFCATINSIIHTRATPVLVDIDPTTGNIDETKIEAAITEKTRAIIPVHLAGRPCEMETIKQIAEAHQLSIMEDCAHAIEAQSNAKHCGTFGDFGCFSFYVTKNLTTGEGGMVLTGNPEHAQKVKRLSLHGLSANAWERYGAVGYKHYEVVEPGFKYNMTDIQATMGLKQLEKLDTYWNRRRSLWLDYDRLLKNLPLDLPSPPPETIKHGHHLYTVMIDRNRAGLSRDEFVQKLNHAGIGVGVHYEIVPEYEFYQKTFNWKPEDYPKALKISRRTVSLPLSAKMTDDDLHRVVHTIEHVCHR